MLTNVVYAIGNDFDMFANKLLLFKLLPTYSIQLSFTPTKHSYCLNAQHKKAIFSLICCAKNMQSITLKQSTNNRHHTHNCIYLEQATPNTQYNVLIYNGEIPCKKYPDIFQV